MCRHASLRASNIKVAAKLAGASTIGGVERLARADRRHAGNTEEWDADIWLLNTPAQLLFSTHDTSLLDPELFRRDQIWFVEKDREQASKLYPLTDFSPRKNEALERGYLIGRYGALPFFSDMHAS